MTITLNNIRLRAFHGCLQQERTVGNDYLVSVSLEVPAAPAAVQDDDLAGTVNYADIYSLVQEEMEIPSSLLEHVCGRIVRHIQNDFPQVEEVVVTVTKLNPPIPGADCDGAGVTLRARRCSGIS